MGYRHTMAEKSVSMKKVIMTISIVVVLLGTAGALLLYATPRSQVSQPAPSPPSISPRPTQSSPSVERGSSAATGSPNPATTNQTGSPQAEKLQIDPQYDVSR